MLRIYQLKDVWRVIKRTIAIALITSLCLKTFYFFNLIFRCNSDDYFIKDISSFLKFYSVTIMFPLPPKKKIKKWKELFKLYFFLCLYLSKTIHLTNSSCNVIESLTFIQGKSEYYCDMVILIWLKRIQFKDSTSSAKISECIHRVYFVLKMKK